MLQFGASLTDDTRSVNYDPNTFIIQATGKLFTTCSKLECLSLSVTNTIVKVRWSILMLINIGLDWKLQYLIMTPGQLFTLLVS
jgi:hypothetical protein